MKNLSDEHIMIKINAGELDYLKILFERYNNQILNYFYRSTGNIHDSKDLAQNVFLKIIKYCKSFKTNMVFKFWLFKMAKNMLASYYSNKSKTTVDIEKVLYETKNNGTEEYKNEDKLLFYAISKLPKEYKELIILSRFTKLKYTEIAEIHDTTEVSIKNKLYRALIKLREIYFETQKTENHEL